jgi:hypothetical protein
MKYGLPWLYGGRRRPKPQRDQILPESLLMATDVKISQQKAISIDIAAMTTL